MKAAGLRIKRFREVWVGDYVEVPYFESRLGIGHTTTMLRVINLVPFGDEVMLFFERPERLRGVVAPQMRYGKWKEKVGRHELLIQSWRFYNATKTL